MSISGTYEPWEVDDNDGSKSEGKKGFIKINYFNHDQKLIKSNK